MQELELEPAGTATIEYAAPETLDEALRLLQEYGEDAKLIAGGQSLLVFLRQGLVAPRILISLKKVAELRALTFSPAEGMQIGAMVTQAEIAQSAPIQAHYAALSDAAAVVATVQVRNQGTLGGNLCHADPTADPPAALIALGAQLHITGPDGARTVPVEAFFRDYMDVDLAPGEVLTRIVLPPPDTRDEPASLPHPGMGMHTLSGTGQSGSAYLKLRVRPVDTALVGAAAWVQLDETDSLVHDARIGLSGAGATPLRALAAEQALRGATASDEVIARAAAAAAADCAPLGDTEASEWYRREMVRTMVQRALARALARARGSL